MLRVHGPRLRKRSRVFTGTPPTAHKRAHCPATGHHSSAVQRALSGDCRRLFQPLAAPPPSPTSMRCAEHLAAAVAALVHAALALVALRAVPAQAAPAPKALSEVKVNHARLQNLQNEFYVRLPDDAEPDTAGTTMDATKHFDLSVVNFVDAAQQHLWAVRSRGGDSYLAVDATSAKKEVVPIAKMNKEEARHVLFRRKTTTCVDTVAFESLTEPNRFLTEVCSHSFERCSLRLAPLNTTAGGNSVCLDEHSHGVPKNALFKVV